MIRSKPYIESVPPEQEENADLAQAIREPHKWDVTPLIKELRQAREKIAELERQLAEFCSDSQAVRNSDPDLPRNQVP